MYYSDEVTSKKFQNTIYSYYRANKRSFPWRKTADPYKIMVSEIMLQQTQTDRVWIKYEEWLKHFPTVETLAQAPLKKVLKHWQGLGYNRRALALKRSAEIIIKKYNKKFPKEYNQILELPGIGPYTAGAVLAFAFNKPIPIIETNIRTVYLHFYFKDHGQVHDKKILELVEKTLDKKNPRDWYHALMDYGVMLKKTIGNLNKKSRHYTRQSQFKGSNREMRSNILSIISGSKSAISVIAIQKALTKNKISYTTLNFNKNLSDLEHEGFIIKKGNKYKIAK
jgi:A/G-specific adenine glycosylase